eukprot:5238307-Amphidinium_carterae.1
MASAYAPGLVKTILEALQNEAKQRSWICELDLRYCGPMPSEKRFETADLKWDSQLAEEYDSITGESLPPDLVEQ